ncbi:MAG: AraC family transcriptional regulator ligand-binding domain-containing protein [Vitreimonas sp.]
MPTDIIRAGALWGYSPLTRSLSHDPEPLLAEVGLSEAAIDNPDHYIPRPAVIALLERTAERLACPDFGMRLADLQDVNVLGALAFAIRNAVDLRGALTAAARHLHYHSPSVTLKIQPSDRPNEVRIVFDYAHQRSSADNPQMTEQNISLACRIDHHLTGDRARPRRVTFAHAQISPSAVYVEHLGLTPEFGAPVDSFCLNRHELDLPMKNANPQLQAIVERYLEMNAPKPGPEIGRRVYQAVAQIMRNGAASIEDVGQMLNMHPRTLQRRLMAQGTSFEKVRDEVRRSMAEIYLADDLVPLAHVAFLLGYANQSVLTRSCLRWFAKTPLAVRDELNGRRARVAG